MTSKPGAVYRSMDELIADLLPGCVAVVAEPTDVVKETAAIVNGPERPKVGRKCLRCHVPFTASGKFNRLCDRCGSLNAQTLDLRSGGHVMNDGETICDV